MAEARNAEKAKETLNLCIFLREHELKGLIGRGNSNKNHDKSKFTATVWTNQCHLSVSVNSVNQHCHKVQPIHK